MRLVVAQRKLARYQRLADQTLDFCRAGGFICYHFVHILESPPFSESVETYWNLSSFDQAPPTESIETQALIECLFLQESLISKSKERLDGQQGWDGARGWPGGGSRGNPSIWCFFHRNKTGFDLPVTSSVSRTR